MTTGLIERLCQLRAENPDAITQAYAARPRPACVPADKLMLIACDHPARGALRAGADALAMADREELLGRCVEALGRPGVNGFLGTADMIEDLLLLGVLDDKVVFASMNRGGLAGASFEMDDRFTGVSAAAVTRNRLEGGKMLVRVDYADPGSVATLEASGRAISQLAEGGAIALVEPFICRREARGLITDLGPEAVIRSMAIAAGLGDTSSHTWLKLPCVDQMERVMAATTLPTLILGGQVDADPAAALATWERALRLPNVRGLVIGRSLLFPPHGDVARAVDEAVELL